MAQFFNRLLSFLARARSLRAAITARELLDPAGGIDEFLLARKKRMASGADADFNIATCRARVIHRAARAHHVGLEILRMNACFHLPKGMRNLITRAHSRKG
jgi:hypothetical protein